MPEGQPKLSFLLLLIALFLVNPTVAERPASDPPSFQEPEVTVERVVWPVVIQPQRGPFAIGKPCSAIGPQDITVTEDGVPAQVTRIDRERNPITHFLVVDVSGSMPPKTFEGIRKTLLDYVEATPPNEKVALARFGEGLELLAAPTRDRKPVIAAIKGIRRLNMRTAAWEALISIAGSIVDRVGRQVLVFISDGGENSSLPPNTMARLIGLFHANPRMVVFPIHPYGLNDSEGMIALREIAEETGGAVLGQTACVEGAVQAIRERLDQMAEITYIPPVIPNEAWKKGSGTGEGLSRKVSIRLAESFACSVRSAGPRQRRRAEIPDLAIQASLVPDDPDWKPVETLGRVGIPASPELKITREYRWKWLENWPQLSGKPAYISALGPDRLALGRIPEVIQDRGILWAPNTLFLKGELTPVSALAPIVAQRTVALYSPPLETLIGRVNQPEDVFLELFRRGVRPLLPDSKILLRRSPFLVEGNTFLEIRPFLAQFLDREYPDYRKWVDARLNQIADQEVADLLTDLSREEPLIPEQLALVKSSYDQYLRKDLPRRRPEVLGTWLGDYPAATLAGRIDRCLISARLAGQPSFNELAFDDRRLWDDLRVWMPPATRVRTLTPLVPIWDPERKEIGFFRVTLPQAFNQRADLEGPTSEPGPLPEAPLGFMVLESLRDDPNSSFLANLGPPTLVDYYYVPGSQVKSLKKRFALPELPGTEVALRWETESGNWEIRGLFRKGSLLPENPPRPWPRLLCARAFGTAEKTPLSGNPVDQVNKILGEKNQLCPEGW